MFFFFSYWSGSVQCSEGSPGSETVNGSETKMIRHLLTHQLLLSMNISNETNLRFIQVHIQVIHL
jgi:hypothetical protein